MVVLSLWICMTTCGRITAQEEADTDALGPGFTPDPLRRDSFPDSPRREGDSALHAESVRFHEASMKEGLARSRAETIERCAAASRALGQRLLFGMTTGLALHGVPVPRDCGLDKERLHTIASTHARRIMNESLGLSPHVWKHFGDGDCLAVNRHIHVLSLFHIWAQMAAHMPLASLVALGDAVVTAEAKRRKEDPERILAEFLAFVRKLPRCRGRRTCVRASRLVRARVDSLQEADGRLNFLCHGIPCPETGYVVTDVKFKSGAEMTLDMAWPEFKVAVEYDGDHHRTDKAQWRRDKEKRDRLRTRDWIIITATAANLANGQARAELAFEVARALALRGAGFTFHVVARAIDRL